ncbi:hypothetical protein GCM10010182_67250 [Actinomadura cremea]|nr:hypothetical protein GCM10010182_67250 [Actinomadura cremea]
MAELTRAELSDRLRRERRRAEAAEERAERLEAELQEAHAGWKGGRPLSPTQMRRIHRLALHQEGLDRAALWTALSELRRLRAALDGEGTVPRLPNGRITPPPGPIVLDGEPEPGA